MKSFVRLDIFVAALALVCCSAASADPAPGEGDSREQVYVIAKGTFARRMAGENVEILPSQIHLVLGVKDVLVLRNDDDVPQLFGPVLIMPGQRFRLPFSRAAKYQFACSLHVNGTLDVIVDPAPSPDATSQVATPASESTSDSGRAR